jgi:MFS transporter, PHS family, inorganic phosphate transporter
MSARDYRPLSKEDISEDDVFSPQKSLAVKPKARKSDFLASMGNFSIQYNLSSASVAVAIMDGSKYPLPEWAHFTLFGMVFAGAVVGMCLLGYLGDHMGRRPAMLLTLSLTLFGTLLSALVPWGGDVDATYGVLSAARFLLGLGVGGKYPLSAAASSETASAGELASQRVGWAFFWQSPGAMFPYIVALVLLQIHGPAAADVQARVLMGLGALPSLMLLFSAWRYEERKDFVGGKTGARLRHALRSKATRDVRALIGTAGTWFIYDVAFYGTNIFTPDITTSIFGEETLTAMCWQSVVVQAVGIPGCLLAVRHVRTLGLYSLNLWGYVVLASLFLAFGLLYVWTATGLAWFKFALFCALMFALNYGPNMATFILPTVCFPPSVRASLHGVSAASAKLGAVTGAFLFKPIVRGWGIAGVMFVQTVLCAIGALLTVYFVDRRAGLTPMHAGLHDADSREALSLEDRIKDDGMHVSDSVSERCGHGVRETSLHTQSLA